MPRAFGVRQLRSRRCGCEKCRAQYPTPERRPTKDCSGSWQGRYTDGTGKRIPITRKRKQDVLDALDAARGTVVTGTHLDPKRGQIKLSAWRAEWSKGRNVEDHTMRSGESLWSAQVGPEWGTSALASISHQEVQKWTVRMERAGLAPDTVRKHVGHLSMLMAAAKRDQRIGVNPCEGITFNPGRGRPAAPDRAPTVDEVDRIAACIRPSGRGRNVLDVFSRLPRVIGETGMRSEEAYGLLPDCVDLEAGWIDVRRVLVNVDGRKYLREYPKSDAGKRLVPLTAVAKRLIAEHFEIQPAKDGAAVFRTFSGRFIERGNFLDDFWIPAAKLAGVYQEVRMPSGKMDRWPTPHHLRHLFATRLENGGVPMSVIKLVCGHEKPKKQDVTWRYIHAPEDPAVYGPIVLAALEGEPATPAGRALRAVA